MKLNKNQKKIMKDLDLNLKMVFIINQELKMGTGKKCAQVGHCTLGLYKKSIKNEEELINSWENTGCKKIVLKIKTESQMNKIQDNANKFNLTTHIVTDAGKTQVAAGSKTVLGIFGESKYINQFVSHLKLA